MLLLALLAGGLVVVPGARPPCPCGDPSLCRPLSPTPKPVDEVVAFPAWQSYGAGLSELEYKLYDWTKITAIAPFEALGFDPVIDGVPANSTKNRNAQGLFCAAHAHGVKVLQWDDRSWTGTRCNASMFFEWAWASDPRVLNATAVRAWAAATAACVRSEGFDGVLLDAEGPCLEFGLSPNGSAACKLPYGPVRAAITSAVCELKAQLQLAVPGSEVHWAAGLPTGATFDYETLMARGCVDLVLNMDYCGSGSPACGPESRGSQAALGDINHTIDTYQGAGITLDHLGIVFPWFGCDFVCNTTDSCAGVLAHPTPMLINPDDYLPASTAAKEFGCGSGVDAGPGYGEVLELLKNATGPAMLAPYPVYTKHFSWRNSTGQLHDVWYDDPETTAVKYRAAKARGVKGLGVWTSDATMLNAVVCTDCTASIRASIDSVIHLICH